MELFIKITQFILSLSILIVLHEFGHFLPAKIFKTRVEKFFYFSMPGVANFLVLKKEAQNTVLGGCP